MPERRARRILVGCWTARHRRRCPPVGAAVVQSLRVRWIVQRGWMPYRFALDNDALSADLRERCERCRIWIARLSRLSLGSGRAA